MYSTDSRMTRILAQPGIDYLEALEAEIERSIILTSGGQGWGNAQDRAARARERFPEAQNPVVVVCAGTLAPPENSNGRWMSLYELPRDFLIDPEGPSVYPYGEIQTVDASPFPSFTIPVERYGERIFAEAGEGIVAIGLGLQRYAEHEDSQANYNWDRLLGDPIRAAISDDIEGLMERLRQERLTAAFDAYVSVGRDRMLRGVRESISLSESRLTNYQSGITQELASLARQTKQLQALEASVNEDGSVWRTRFDELASHPKLTDVEFVDDRFVLTTDHLRITNPNTGDSRWLGRIKITVPLGGGDWGYAIQFHNLDNPKGSRAHPHVAGDGPCFGRITSAVAQLHADMELVALVDLLLMFLESFNPEDDWGSYAAYWFDADDEDPRPEFNPTVADEDELELVA